MLHFNNRVEQFIEEENMLALGQELEALTRHSSWSTFTQLIEALKGYARRDAIYDESRSRDYWRGLLDGLCIPVQEVERILSLAREEDKREQNKGRIRTLQGDPDAGPSF